MQQTLFHYIREYFNMKELKTSDRGTVYIVQHKITKRRFIYREFFGSGEVYHKMKRIESPHLPRIEAVEEENGYTYVLEEYIQGETLAFLLREGCSMEREAASIVIQLCAALDELHSLGIVHRDIKPENIIIRGDTAVLIDFDTSRVNRKEQSTDTQVMGTAGYAAPEQYGFAQTDARADIYALGILLNELLIRKHPSRQLAESEYQPIISKCIEVNVDKRYSSAKELQEVLGMLQKANRGKSGVRKWCVLIASIAILCILIGCIMQGILTRTSDPSQIQNQTSDHSQSEPPTEFRWEDIDFDLHNRGYRTPFWYDLDGDGQLEEYLFGVSFYNTLQDRVLDGDVVGVPKEESIKRSPFPCVWKRSEEGEWIIATEFADLLEEPETRLEFLSEWKNELPTVDALDAEWRGGIEIFYTREHIGTWLYTVNARVDGIELTAALTTSLFIYDETENS